LFYFAHCTYWSCTVGAYSCCHSHLNIYHFSCHMQHSVHIVHMFPYNSGHRYYLDKLKNRKKHELFMHIIWKGLRRKSKIPYVS
jgi:hypothetical protein